MKKIFLLILASVLLIPQAFAGPFDILNSNIPDFVVSNIGQDTNSEYVYVSVCNKGGSMDGYGSLTIGVKRNYTNGPSSSIVVDDIRFTGGECNSYQITNIANLGITSNGTYALAGGVRLSNYSRSESNSNNNILIKDVYLNSYNNYNPSYPNYNSSPSYPYNNYYPSYPNYYYSNLPDLTVNDINYYDKTTVTDSASTREILNSIVASVCNVGGNINNGGSIRARIEIAGKSDYVYMNTTGYWAEGQCKKIWSSMNNYSINFNTSYGVGVSIDDTNVISEGNEGNNYLYKSIYIPTYSNLNYNYSSNGYYCNNVWYNYSNNSNGYSCNGTWYNRNTYNSGPDTYFCNNTWYTYAYNATGYYCNNRWYDRANQSNGNGYYCNNSWHNYNNNATGYYCGDKWYNRNYNNNNTTSNGYYCNNVWYTYNSNTSNGYNCNGTWYYRNYTDNYQNNSNGYYCNGSWFNSNSDKYYCNGTWYNNSSSSNSNNTNTSNNSITDLSVKSIFINNGNRRVYAQICNYGTYSVNTYGTVNFYSSTTGKSKSVTTNFDLYAGGCTDLYTYVSYADLGIYSSGNFTIRASLSPANSNTYRNTEMTNTVWIPY